MGQENNDSGPLVNLVELDYRFTLPVNNYKTELNKNYHGANLTYFRQAGFDRPHFWGMSLGYGKLDGDRDVFIDAFGFDTTRGVSINHVNIELGYRIYPKGYFWKFDPFISFFLGTNFHYTTIADSDFESGESLSYDFEDFSTSLSYRVALGTHYQISDSWFMNFKFSYGGGNVTQYRVDNGNNSDDPYENFDIASSSVEMINMYIGLNFAF